ncbi:MAG: hypothetical protein D8M57_08500 [Candidatus Scalindua sp. AMX11]|nr:MAG: hypothetical protein DWQ00_05350 [Candidatus Scalindua sp.]NOG84380.1 hypothetical protein [Planctomycetota bacterium]RZV65767.1 MAG: hypothetical protein EX341_17845 [Candidatus Scalindua sp. SCAELEC01]TDE65383.1 MAG: hypothetical protein D8M57_08500 [Candidatus Scalindua sp. AMX11]GJQ60332.1 MAG: hypothetical protein SCALA701_31330 [Candidatus Scalindua sp.]
MSIKKRYNRRKKRPFRKKVLAILGIRHVTNNCIFFYVLAFFILALLIIPLVSLILGIKENFDKDYYAPRDFKRVEKLKREGKSIPFMPPEKNYW